MGIHSEIHATRAIDKKLKGLGPTTDELEERAEMEQARLAEQQEQSVEQVVEETVEAVEEAIQVPETPDPGRFEEWLATQKDREDGVGKIAKFVLEDMQRKCWRETAIAPDYEALHYNSQWIGRIKKYCVEHLILRHDANGRSIEIFEEVWAEYLAARWAFETRNFRVQPSVEHPADFS